MSKQELNRVEEQPKAAKTRHMSIISFPISKTFPKHSMSYCFVYNTQNIYVKAIKCFPLLEIKPIKY